MPATKLPSVGRNKWYSAQFRQDLQIDVVSQFRPYWLLAHLGKNFSYFLTGSGGNPAGDDADLSFVADDKVTYELLAQHFQSFPQGQEGIISFDKGTGETARYTVKEGSFDFRPTDKGWDLFKMTAKATIDNSANPSDFSFAIADKTYTIAAGETQELTGPYALAVRFDNGSGQLHEKRILKGSFKVAADGTRGTLDLFDEKDVPVASESEMPSGAEPGDPELQEMFAAIPAGLLGPGSTGSIEDREAQSNQTSGSIAKNQPLIVPPSE
jgi:hypothetical protein